MNKEELVSNLKTQLNKFHWNYKEGIDFDWIRNVDESKIFMLLNFGNKMFPSEVANEILKYLYDYVEYTICKQCRKRMNKKHVSPCKNLLLHYTTYCSSVICEPIHLYY